MRILDSGYQYVLSAVPREKFIETATNAFDIYTCLYDVINNALLVDTIHTKVMERKIHEDLLENYCANLMSCYYLFFNHHKLPILKIQNPILIKMLSNTDINYEIVKNIQLPFSKFYIEADLDDDEHGRRVEYLIEQHEDTGGVSIIGSSTYSGQNSFIFNAGYFESLHNYKHLPLYLSEVVNAGKHKYKYNVEELTYKLEEELELFNKTIVPILFFLSTKKAKKIVADNIENIKSHSRSQAKNTNELNNTKPNFIPFYLFKDAVYTSNLNVEYSTGKKKNAHLVRGHFRNQPYGSRKNGEIVYEVIWIAPYFTGEIRPESKVYLAK